MEKDRTEPRAASLGAYYAQHRKDRFGPTYGCVEWFFYEEPKPVARRS